MASRDTYILIPAYNEAIVIRGVLESLLKLPYQLILIDDGSTDGTEALVKDLPIHYLRHHINMGQGAALQTGFTYARRRNAEMVICFDADGQHDPNDIPLLLAPLVNGETDIVFGSRFMKGAVTNISFARRCLVHMARLVNFFFTGLWLSDAHNGLRALNQEALAQTKLLENHSAHASEFLFLIKKWNWKWKEVPVHIHYSNYSRRKGAKPASGFKIFIDLTLHKLFE